MKVEILKDKEAIARRAAEEGAGAIRAAIGERGKARIVVATGRSQIELLAALAAAPGIDWSRVTIFHLDEFLGIPEAHPASFRRFLHEHLLHRLPDLGAFVPVAGDATDPAAEIARLNALFDAEPIDLCFAGIGENGHIAFNDPPADFETGDPFALVTLAEVTRRQQLWIDAFATIEDVPKRAITMSMRAIMRSEELIVTAPDVRKAEAVRDALEGPVTPYCPASLLREHPHCTMLLDPPAASLLRDRRHA